jgi:hypothetical protein
MSLKARQLDRDRSEHFNSEKATELTPVDNIVSHHDSLLRLTSAFHPLRSLSQPATQVPMARLRNNLPFLGNRRVRGMIAVALGLGTALLFFGGCQKRIDQRICNTRPPYDDRQYEAWLKELAEAKCPDYVRAKKERTQVEGDLAQ